MDDEPLYMLMMLVHDDGPQGVSIWKAALVEGLGSALTREQAEEIVSREGPARVSSTSSRTRRSTSPARTAAPRR